jgi:S1-C subfamily serine protease
MDKKTNTRRWLVCGIIFVVGACLAVVIGFGGLAAIGVLFGEGTPTSEVVDNQIQPTFTSAPTSTIAPVVSAATPTSPAELRPIPFESVVQIVALYYDESNQLAMGWTGSGSIISPDGLILTNAHVALPDRYFPVDALAIAFTVREDSIPEVRFFAEVVQADQSLDIAVLRITQDLDGNPVGPDSLDLPYVPLGNADDLRLGDQITILGYPGIGGDTITLTRGEVSGFTSELDRGDRAFIKTSATIAGGNSGGLAADAEGYLIGIPTQLGYGGEDQFVDCRVLADTNRDGVVDDLDNCIPTGGFINALRPINLALPLIEAAHQGIISVHQEESTPLVSAEEMPDEGSVVFEDDFSTVKGKWLWSGSAGEISHVENELQIEVVESEYFIWGLAGQSISDVIVDVDARVIQQAGDGDFGIICRYQDNENFYGMEISEDGYYAIWKYVSGKYIPLVDWKPSSLLADTSSGVHLTASCVDDLLALSVNGEYLAETRDGDFSSGDVGLVSGTLEKSPLITRFDNLVVSKPEETP